MKKLLFTGIMAVSLINFMSCNNNESKRSASETTTTDSSAAVKSSDSAAGKTVDKDAVDFVNDAAMGGMMEVEAGKLAAKNAMRGEVKQFGEKMVKDHSKANEELMALAKTKNLNPPMTMSDDHEKKMKDLSEKKGKDFDKAYVDMMVKDHDKDVDKFEKAAKDLKDPDLRAWADKTVPVLKSHKDLIHKIKDGMK